MKKLWTFRALGVVLLLTALLLAGCGKKDSPPTGPVTSKIFFRIPNKYQVENDDNVYRITEGKTIKIYVLPPDYQENEPIAAEEAFTGTTTGEPSMLSFDLPSGLVGKNRSFIAVIILDEDFDPDGKSQSDLQKAVQEGKILLGLTSEEPGLKQYTIISGLAVEDFFFWGGAAMGEPQDFEISIVMPTEYQDVISNDLNNIPKAKTVKFYILTDPPDKDGTFAPEQTFSGTTGTNRIFGTVPASLINKECYLLAVVVLQGDFDLKGNTKDNLLDAVRDKTILFGQIPDHKPYILTHGLTIEDFVFIGKGEVIAKFKLPREYQTLDQTNPQYYPMPKGYPIDFYCTTEAGTDIFDSDAVVISGTIPKSGGPVVCELPDELYGGQYYIHAIIRLKGVFDLKGMPKDELLLAVTNGTVLYGNIEGGDKITFTNNVEVEGFIFYGPEK